MIMHITITLSGNVQGVFFRQTTKQFADSLGVTGFVKNEDNGSVSISAEGEKCLLDELVVAVKNGFGYTKVENVKSEWSNAEEHYDGFSAL